MLRKQQSWSIAEIYLLFLVLGTQTLRESVIDGIGEKYRKRKIKSRGAHNRRLRTVLVDAAPPLLVLA